MASGRRPDALSGGDYSPVAAFHEIYVNHMPVGLFLSHQCGSEGPAEAEPFMMFYRQADGGLRLYGYALPSGDHLTNYFLDPPAGGTAASSLRAAAGSDTSSADFAQCLGTA